MMRGPEFAGAPVARVEHQELRDGSWEFTFNDAGPGEDAVDLDATREMLLALGEAGATISIRQRRAPIRDVVFASDAVPGFGWQTYRAVEGDGPTTSVRADGLELANEHVRVGVDAQDGTLTIESDNVRVSGANRYVDGGDGGDTYNYSPPAVDLVVDRPMSVAVEVQESGPVRARVEVTARYGLPSHAVGDERSCTSRSDGTVVTEIRTTLELRTGERFLRVHVEFDHRVRDHRLRAHFPLPAKVNRSDADCAFAVVSRGLTAEGGAHEFGLPTFVSRRFVDCAGENAGLALLHDGLLEYEVVDTGPHRQQELALTLVRATGFLSRSELSLRPNPAGPLDPLEGPQLQRRLALDYAVLPHQGDWRDAGLPAAADDFLVPFAQVRGGGWPGAARPPLGRALDVDGAAVSALLRDDNGRLTARLFNPSPEPVLATVARADGQPATGEVVDLSGRALGTFVGSVPLGPGEMATLQIREA
jgi:hypothetical protein